MGSAETEMLESLRCVCGRQATISVDRNQKFGPRYNAYCSGCYLINVVGDFPEEVVQGWEMAIREIYDNMDETFYDENDQYWPEDSGLEDFFDDEVE